MSVNAHDEKANTIDYLRRTAKATEATARHACSIKWLLIFAIMLFFMFPFIWPHQSAVMNGYNAEMARQATIQATRPAPR